MQVKVELQQNAYKVYIDEFKNLSFNTKVFIVSNSKILDLHLEKLLAKIKAKELFIARLKEGEEYKNLSTLEELLEQMFAFKLDRKSVLINFGGGVISDMGAFAASIYQRGISFINIPTTLLACVDAAIGGKTGINNAFGKNLIGSFYQPKAVYCQSEFLKTLALKELSAGMAEVIKIALVLDKKFFEFIENIDEKNFFDPNFNSKIFTQIITKSVKLKAKIIELDEKELGLRMLLNYGHTFAHAIEHLTNYKAYLHGEAVAIGINMANHLAFNLGLLTKMECQRIEQVLLKFKLPIHYKINNIDQFYEAFFRDKKSSNKKLSFILVHPLGKGLVKSDISKKDIILSLKDFQ